VPVRVSHATATKFAGPTSVAERRLGAPRPTSTFDRAVKPPYLPNDLGSKSSALTMLALLPVARMTNSPLRSA